jgi:hypothetical protein
MEYFPYPSAPLVLNSSTSSLAQPTCPSPTRPVPSSPIRSLNCGHRAGRGNAPGSQACATNSPPSSSGSTFIPQDSSLSLLFFVSHPLCRSYYHDYWPLVSPMPKVRSMVLYSLPSVPWICTHCIAGDGKLHSASHPMLVSYTTSISDTHRATSAGTVDGGRNPPTIGEWLSALSYPPRCLISYACKSVRHRDRM